MDSTHYYDLANPNYMFWFNSLILPIYTLDVHILIRPTLFGGRQIKHMPPELYYI